MLNPTIDLLQKIQTLSEFSYSQLEALAPTLMIQAATKGQTLIKNGCIEPFSLYLLSGSIVTIAADGSKKVIESALNGEIPPIANRPPSLYDVEALTDISYVKIHLDQLSGFAQQAENLDCSIDVTTFEQTEEESKLTIMLLQNIVSGDINLPSLPEVAQRIQDAFSDSEISTQEVIKIIQSDPVITAKIIKVANSALYQGSVQVDTLGQAIIRMGLETTRKQVITYAVKELFTSSSTYIQERMKRVWKHSRRVAAFSRALANKTKLFDPEQAQLAGLIHDLGEVAILQFIQDQPDLYSDDETLLDAISKLRPQITSMLLHKWNFTDELITVGEESEQWFRNPYDQADLCDLVLISQCHSFIGSGEMKDLPPILKLPAFAKLGLSTKEPEQIMVFMTQSKAEIEAIEQVLGSL